MSSLCGFSHLHVSHKCVEIRSPTIRKDIFYGFQRISEDNLFVAELKEIDTRLQAEAANETVLLKNIIIRLEDARILENIDEMRKRLVQLKNVNVDLIREHEIRMKSYRELTANLKELNLGVQRAARLRGDIFYLTFAYFPFAQNKVLLKFVLLVGKSASNTIARCRAAIQDENPKALTMAIRHG